MAGYNKWPSIGEAYTGSSNNNDGQQAGAGRGGGPVFEKPDVTSPVFEKPDFAANSGGNGGNNNGNKNKSVYGDNDFNEGSKSSPKIDIPKMNGNNYNEWAQTVRLVLDGKGKLGFLTGAVAEPAEGDPLYKQWKSENSLIIAWLVSTMETGLGKPYMFLPSAKDVWEAVKETYSDIQNASQIFGLKSKLWHAKQGDRNVTAYYNELLTLWQELDLCYDDNWKCAEDSVLFLKRQENDRVFMFLAGLNKDLDEVRGRVLGKVPLPTLRETFAEIKREESRQGIMMGKTHRSSESEGSALATRNPHEGKKSDEIPWCDYCKREWHTREDCWKLKGKPPNWTPNWKKKKGGRAFQASNSDQGQQSTSTQSPLTTEQLEKLFKLLESQTPSCSIATKGNSVFLSVSPNHTWIVDSGASDHMTGESTLFSSYSPCAGNQKIKVADGSFSAIAGKGSVVLSPMLTLKNVLHVPNLSCSLMSVSKLAQDINCQTNFFRSHCVFQDLNSGKMIGSAEESGGLYYFDIGSASQLPSETISSCFESFSVLNNNDDNIMLWHLRLGHPSFPYLKHLFPKLFRNKDISLFKCEACEFAKHHRSHFAIQPYKPSKPFSVIHSDVWGPNRTSTLSLKKWFITFIDDHSRVCWVYLLKGKYDVCQVVKDFCTMVQNQYQTNIQVFRSDNGKEYFNTNLGDFFLQNGIIHQSSCPNTPQQNGVAERKNRHLLEVARALLFSSKVPNYLWGEAVLTAAYLINRMPSKVLNFQTPIDTFKECFPSTRVSTDLILKIFGCTAFVHEHKNVGKLEPRAIKCVFVGYSPTQKGYKCFDPKNKKMYVTMDVTFFENKYFFDDTHLQVGNLKEDSFQTEDMSFFNNLSLPESQSSKTYNFAPTENGHDSLSDPTPDMSKEFGESEPTFPHDENHENFESNGNDDLIEMPQSSESLKENRFEAGNNIWKGKVFVRKNHKKSDESTSQQCHESEPGNDRPPKNRKSKYISVSESRVLYPDIDDPIAVRKPLRSCTKHPLSNFISYSNLSSSFSAFTSKLSCVEIPKNVQVALEVPKWREAVLEEMKALEKNKTWSVMTLPDGKKTVGCKWVFTVKYNSDGSIERYKARLVAKGFTQTYGIDYSETFAPVAKLNTVRILLSLAANLDWPLHQLDVKNAFLNGDLEEEVYMDIPPGFEDRFGSNVCKLNKSLYGLKQSPRAWFEKFTQSMKKQGYIQGQADHTLFTKFSQDGKIAVLIVYVDDIVLTGNDTDEMGRVKEKLAVDFEIKDLGSMRYFLGMEVARSKDGIVVSQQKYILDLLKETGMSGCRPADTPMDPNAKLWEKGSVPVDTGRYQRLVGKLIYLSHTRPDIAFSVSVVSQFMHSPFEEHLEAVYRILRYLKANPGKGLFFRKTNERNVSIFTDADWAGSITDRRSTSGYCAYVWGNLVTWRSKKQGVVARSSAEAEFRAMAQGICEGLWIHRVLEELKMKIELPLKLYSDSKAAISIAHNPVQHDRTKHIEIDRHFIKEKLDAGIICLPFVTSSQQTADI
ncbi:putative mitochondrial protein [Trifolium repens]|nr:putative mitochondrial protein [Trifolium repens]